ncbi:MAG: YdcF family protein [Ferruginibacter sp.]|nr:YdcF family protein [Ferruginibacter sp.]
MHYYLSSFISFFLSPAVWIMIFIFLYVRAKSSKRKKIFLYTTISIFLLFSNQWLITAYARWWHPKPLNDNDKTEYSCAILLGGFGSPDYNEKGYFNFAADRFIQAVRQYKLGKVKYILISGGNGKVKVKNFNEGEWTRSELKIMGLPDSAILFEDKSTNTAENVVNTKKLLDSAGLKPPYMLISSAHHLPRATLLFQKAGIMTTALPCNFIAGTEAYNLSGIIPDLNVLFTWNSYFKETFAYLLYKIKG